MERFVNFVCRSQRFFKFVLILGFLFALSGCAMFSDGEDSTKENTCDPLQKDYNTEKSAYDNADIDYTTEEEKFLSNEQAVIDAKVEYNEWVDYCTIYKEECEKKKGDVFYQTCLNNLKIAEEDRDRASKAVEAATKEYDASAKNLEKLGKLRGEAETKMTEADKLLQACLKTVAESKGS